MASVAAVAVLGGAPAAAGPAHPAQAPPAVSYVPPVDAPVDDPFRPPPGPYGAGNRGVEYGTVAGTSVQASAAGTVTFAGPVGGELHVTVLHRDGVRTSYSFLASIEVALGQHVRQGDPVGTTGERLHFGARIGDAYFDPAVLFAGTVTEVELLPFEVPPGSTPESEARALAELALTGGGLSLPTPADTIAWLRDRSRSGVTYARQLHPARRGLEVAADLVERLVFPPPCSSAPPPVRPIAGQERVAVTVAGLGSTSEAAAIDDLRTADLGYEHDRVVRFSYAGGRTPTSGAGLGSVRASAYTSADTQGDVVVAGARLADLVEEVGRAAPDAQIDLYAHSLGGLVTRVALADLDGRGFDLGRIGLVSTLATPHRGADAATAVVAANAHLGPNLALDLAERVLDTGLDPDAPVVRQLAEHSDLVAELAVEALPGDLQMVSIAARGDLVAAAPRTTVPGATNITVPVSGWGAHSDVVASDAATAEMARALGGEPRGCESAADVIADVAVGHAVSLVEDQVGAAITVVGG
jgi:hypothetical protein